ncbi:MAG TPA: sigma 54-interacting transcriptional regulator [Terriglobia bacterium]|nr:sigma 54-interacting transcriptional regulator [Terriglobia bacterium]
MNPRLIALSGPLRGAHYPIEDDEFTLGRDEGNSILVPDPAVSRRHCVIRRNGGTFRLIDLQSRNGCLVNNVRVQEHDLKHSDHISIGDSLFRFALSDEGGGQASAGIDLDDSRLFSSHTVQLRPEDAAILHPQNFLTGGVPTVRQARDLEALFRVFQALDSSHDVPTLARALLDFIMDLVPADLAAILVVEESGGIRPVHGRWRRADDNRSVPVSRTLARDVVASKQVLMCNDVLQDTRIAHTESILASPVSALLVAPVLWREKCIAVIYLAASSLLRPFDDADHHLVAGLASMSAPAFASARQMERLQEEKRRLQGELGIEHRMVGNSAATQEVHRFIKKAAPAGSTVLITGESGTGKELVARALHESSARASGPFRAVNSAALSESLLASEIFGHEKGAFTGAVATRKGLIEAAHGGTLFLDEVGDMSPSLQAKLLRVIQERKFERVGGTETLSVDVRIIAATNRDLKAAIRAGTFREDLHFRLNVLSIEVPPLRERREDIIPLARHFLERYQRREKRREAELSPEAEACLEQYDWPGNVRELEHLIERALVMTSGVIIDRADLPPEVRGSGEPPGSGSRYHDAIIRARKQVILQALRQAGGVYKEAARLLGIQDTYLHRVIRELGLKDQVKR